MLCGPECREKGAAVDAMWLIPLLCAAIVGGALASGTRHARPTREIDRCAQALVRDDRIHALRERLANEPDVVWSARRPSPLLESNRLVLQLDREQLDVSCFWPSTKPITALRGLGFHNAVGWYLDVLGPEGTQRLYAWRLDIHPVASRHAARR